MHAATLRKDDKTLILCNPSGSEKSTLASFLVKTGFEPIHDDVLPIRPDGQIEMLNSPSTVKEGSWPLLLDVGLELPKEHYKHLGAKVKYLPVRNMKKVQPAENLHIIFPTYKPGHPVQLNNISQMESFKGIVGKECVIRNRSIDHLQKIFC